MRQSFKVSFYLRSNYENKEGKSPVMLRIFLSGAMSNLSSTKIFVDKAQWNSRTSREKGRSSEALAVNASLDAISTSLHSLYHKYQDDQTISLDKLRSAYLGKIQEFSTFLPVFDKFIDDIRERVEHTISKESLQKYSVLRRHFFEFLVHRYKRKDIGLMEFTPAIIQDFELYLTTVALYAYNTAVKKMKTLKTVTIYALKRGYLLQDPFRDHHFHLTPVDRGFLTNEEILRIANKSTSQRIILLKEKSHQYIELYSVGVSLVGELTVRELLRLILSPLEKCHVTLNLRRLRGDKSVRSSSTKSVLMRITGLL